MNQLLIDIVTKKVKHHLYEELLKKFPKGSGQNASLAELSEMRDAVFETLAAIENESIVEDTIIIEISCGAIQNISTTKQVKLVILDSSTNKDADNNKIINKTLVGITVSNLDPSQEYCYNILEQIK